MKAIRIFEHGAADVVQFVQCAEPEPEAGQVKIKIQYTSLNHMDVWVRKGIPGLPALPLTLGCDGMGVVVACGTGVTQFRAGERVLINPLVTCGVCRACTSGRENLCRQFQIMGEHRDGVHAEFVCVPAHQVIPVDSSVSGQDAVAALLTGQTSWHMLNERAKVQAGERVLVVGAASGIGYLAVQMAKVLGATVMATAGSDDKLALLKSCGADGVVNHYTHSIADAVKDWTGGEGVDVIFEHVGAKVFKECLKSLAWGGRLVTCGATSGPKVELDLRHVFIKQFSILGSTMGTRADLQAVQAMLASRQIKPHISHVFKPEQIQEAHRVLEASQHVGKIVVVWE